MRELSDLSDVILLGLVAESSTVRWVMRCARASSTRPSVRPADAPPRRQGGPVGPGRLGGNPRRGPHGAGALEPPHTSAKHYSYDVLGSSTNVVGDAMSGSACGSFTLLSAQVRENHTSRYFHCLTRHIIRPMFRSRTPAEVNR